jgi:glycosyltransferase involved in cell wall biosynthesis
MASPGSSFADVSSGPQIPDQAHSHQGAVAMSQAIWRQRRGAAAVREQISIPGSSARDISSSPRVLLVVEQLRRRIPGGIGTYARGLIRGLAEAPDGRTAPEITLLASRAPRRSTQHNGSDPLEGFGLATSISRLPGPALTRAWDHRILRAPPSYDVVHSTSPAFPALRQTGSSARGASVVAIHDLAWRRLPETTTRRGRSWHDAVLQRALRAADAFVVPSEMTSSDLAEAGAPSSRINVIPYGADHLAHPDVERTEALLDRLGVGAEFLLSVGTLEPRKNLSRLLIAYGAARSKLPERWPLLIVGPTGWKNDFTSIDPAGVHRLGSVDEGVLAGLYARARLLAYVPLLEGYGFPPLEAMRRGTPVVASHGVPSIIEASGAEAAFMVDPTDIGSIEAGIVAAATDSDQRLRVVNRGMSLVRHRTWHRTAVDHADLWLSFQ